MLRNEVTSWQFIISIREKRTLAEDKQSYLNFGEEIEH